MYRYIMVVLCVWLVMPFDVMAADRVVRFPKLAHYAVYSVIRMDAYRSVITHKDMKEDRFPEKRGIVKEGLLDNSVFVGGVSSVRIPAGHALFVSAVIPDAGGDDLVSINLSFLDGLANNDLCAIDVSRNVLPCQQMKTLSRFSRLVELRVVVGKECNDPLFLDELKNLEVLQLTFEKIPNAQEATEWVTAVAKHKSLKALMLHHFRVNDDNLKTLTSLTKLELLQFNDRLTDVTDRGLTELRTLTNLREVCLSVGGPAVTDAGLKPFFQMRHLEKLLLYGDYSPAARERLQLAHPKAEFEFSDLRRE